MISIHVSGEDLSRFSREQLLASENNNTTLESTEKDNTYNAQEIDKPFGLGLFFGSFFAFTTGLIVYDNFEPGSGESPELARIGMVLFYSSLANYIGFPIGISLGCKSEGIKCPILLLYGWGLFGYFGSMLITVATKGYGFPVLYFLPMYFITRTYHNYKNKMDKTEISNNDQIGLFNRNHLEYYKLNIINININF